MLRLIVFAIVGISLIYIATEILKFLAAINGTKSQMVSDKAKFLKNLDRSEFVEWPWEELNTLSLQIDFGLSKYDMISSAQEGVYLSIFSENVGQMLSKKYGEKEMMLIATEKNTFELTNGDNDEVFLTIESETPLKVEFNKNSLSFAKEGTKYKLTKTAKRAEIFIDSKSLLITNEDNKNDQSMRRLVQVIPEDLNSSHHNFVKFLLLFYLIWQQDS
ncbi:MAG: hypothetical protein V3V00_01285 [Saprospiraceae bacterium]